MIEYDTLERVEDYIYLGQIIINYCKPYRGGKNQKWDEMEHFGKHSPIMNSKLPLLQKRKVTNQRGLPVLTYSAIMRKSGASQKTWRVSLEVH